MTYAVGDLVMKGECYLALTSHMVMAGLQIDATLQSGSLKVWFSAGLDFLLDWRPFHYVADAYIHIGASFPLDLGFTSLDIVIHVGVDLTIWGPPFGGKATIDLDILSFSIQFGDTQRVESVDWAEFKSSFLPVRKESSKEPRVVRMAAPSAGGQESSNAADEQLCTANVSDGLLKDLKAKEPDEFFSWLVDANHFAIASNTVIPSKKAAYNEFDLITPFNEASGLKYNGGASPKLTPEPKYDKNKYPDGLRWSDQFGVLPMRLDAADFQTAHTIEIKKLPAGEDYKDGEKYTEHVDNLSIEPLLKNSQTALWGVSNPGLNGSRVVESTLVGLQLSPMIQHPEITLKADLWRMMFDQSQPIEWQLSNLPVVDRNDTVKAQVTADGTSLSFTVEGRNITCKDFELAALTDSAVDQTRTAVKESLIELGLAFDVAIDVTDLAQHPLWDWPMIRSLGEEISPS
jgi:hypothetical protein